MALGNALLPEFDQEMATTRKTLERIPENKTDWKPHAKSMTMGRLGGHLAELPNFVVAALNNDVFDLHPPGAAPRPPFAMTSRQQLLEAFDKNVAAARAALAGASDEHLMKPWTLQNGGKTIFTMPRVAVLRHLTLNHLIHHRGQLSVYLRENDIPVPAIYGPSADEGGA